MEAKNGKRLLFLAVDTCGATGGCALAECSASGSISLTGEKTLEGRNVSSTLIPAIGELLAETGVSLSDLNGLVVVHGPGSFTGVRVGLSAVKGIAEAMNLPLLAVSRLEVLTAANGVEAGAIDAHRHEIFLRLSEEPARELLAGGEELSAVKALPQVAVCDDAAAQLLAKFRPECKLLRVAAPTAGQALELAIPRMLAGERSDVALLDGHYLRRSDAEIFGESTHAGRSRD